MNDLQRDMRAVIDGYTGDVTTPVKLVNLAERPSIKGRRRRGWYARLMAWVNAPRVTSW